MSKEQIDIIDDLLTSFDEMGFAPTTAVPDPESYAIEWRNKLANVLQGYRKQSEGKWLFKPTVSRTPSAINYTCSLCGFESARTTPFCPECGAKMKGDEE